MSILKGTMFITHDPEVISNIPLNTYRIVTMDEFSNFGDNPAFIGGTCLLPPIEAKIAEADNNEYLYDTLYQSHLLEPYQQQFIGALISYLYTGGNIIFFLPDEAYDNTRTKFIENMWIMFGIHVGIIGAQDPNVANCYFDDRCTVIWLNMIYTSNVISGKEYLFLLPPDVPVTNNQEALVMLTDELNPYGQTINEKISTLEHFRKAVKGKIAVNLVLGSLRS